MKDLHIVVLQQDVCLGLVIVDAEDLHDAERIARRLPEVQIVEALGAFLFGFMLPGEAFADERGRQSLTTFDALPKNCVLAPEMITDWCMGA